MNILPKPRDHVKKKGTLYIGNSIHVTGDARSARQVLLITEYFRASGYTVTDSRRPGTIHISCRSIEDPVYDSAGFCDESYRLEIAKQGIHIEGNNRTGTARGIQTLRQLFPPECLQGTAEVSPFAVPQSPPPPKAPVELQCCIISDHPEFRWRGVHLDVSRHFFSPADVARFIDLAAFHRLNRMHLHLTDDQGWRLEIKAYPLLTQRGAYRDGTLIGHYSDSPRRFDNRPYGGFYTQDEIKALVSFAGNREIEIVPEIDMPGHMQAAVASYPSWGKSGENPEVSRIWGISKHILNTEPGTLNAMKNILTEVIELFPSRFIHIGGDEAPKDEWKKSTRIQRRMKEYGCKTEEELQGWFMRQMDDFLSDHGRRSIGWDEIIEGGLPQHAAVMSWRGEAGGITAASMGHDVVMAPEKYTYLDHYQNLPIETEPLAIGGYTPLSKIYLFNPLPAGLSAGRRRHILGAQCQLWSEYIANRDQLDYMTFPRLCALAENLWLGEEEKNYDAFLERLAIHMKRLKSLKVNAASYSTEHL